MRDGTQLSTDVYRPAAPGRYPVLLQRTPYDKRAHPVTWATLDPLRMAASEYVVAIQDVRGRFGSAGFFEGPYLAESADGADALEWAATQPWSNGRVGTYGLSYMGGVQWLMAAGASAHLRAIAPATSPHDVVVDHFRRGGALQLGLLAFWTTAVIGPGELRRRAAADPSRRGQLLELVDDIDQLDALVRALPLSPFEPLRRHTDTFGGWFDEFAREPLGPSSRSSQGIVGRHDSVRVPALQLAGWFDVLLNADLEHFVALRTSGGSQEARDHTRIVIGPWVHGSFSAVVGEVDFGIRADGAALDLRGDLTALHGRWFDQRLKDQDTGIDAEPPVRLFVMGRNRWRDFDEWPPKGYEPRPWYLRDGGGLARVVPTETGSGSEFRLDPGDPVPSCGGALLMAPRHVRGPRNQEATERHPDVLLFTSEPLDEELEIIGHVSFVGWIATSTPDSDVVVRLCDVRPDGRSFNVTDGVLRLRYRAGLDSPLDMPINEPVRVHVDMAATAHVVKKGHRLRLHVCASDFPRYDRCAGTGETATASAIVWQRNKVLHDRQFPSHVLLPVAD
jgi:putative CocE/NonD family hydrolase